MPWQCEWSALGAARPCRNAKDEMELHKFHTAVLTVGKVSFFQKIAGFELFLQHLRELSQLCTVRTRPLRQFTKLPSVSCGCIDCQGFLA